MPQIKLADNLLHLPTLGGPHEDFAGDIGSLRIGRKISSQALHRDGQVRAEEQVLFNCESRFGKKTRMKLIFTGKVPSYRSIQPSYRDS